MKNSLNYVANINFGLFSKKEINEKIFWKKPKYHS